MKINIVDILDSLNKAQSVISPELGAHQRQVAYLAYRMAKQLKWPQETRNKVFIAGLLHDIGALSFQEKEAVVAGTEDIHVHARRGAYLISNFLPQRHIAPVIKYHHVPWQNGKSVEENPDMPMESQLLYLTDRICVNIIGSKFILSQISYLKEYSKRNRGELFVPEYVDAFLELAANESVWLDLVSDDLISKIDYSYIASTDVSMDDLVDLARIYSYLIDFRSPFTATHSAGVAKVAQKLAELLHFSPTDCKKIMVAGYLHDLGKLAVDNAILEKQSALDPEEFDVIRSHTYYTYYLLDGIAGLDDLKRWAAYHHERLNGTGYPFHIGEANLGLGARIMAVADVFSALQEKRPYKEPMSQAETTSILNRMVENGSLDSYIVSTLLKNFTALAEIFIHAGEQAVKEYGILYDIGVTNQSKNEGPIGENELSRPI
ncbi:MAG: HD-GYP domain-containing protein [Lawsonibacter sp.]